jgi:two-component system response regulator AtoC
MSESRTLIIDDEETYARALQRLLGRRGIEADVATTAAEGLLRARRTAYTLVVLDYLLPDGTGLELIAPLRQLRPAPAVLMMTAYGTIENAVEAMRRGATDYVPKSTALGDVVDRVAEAERVARAAQKAPVTPASQAATQSLTQAFLGESAAMKEVRARIHEVAASPDTTVLLHGESGTGKGIAARAIHGLSARSAEPYVAIDCVALPAPLAESELFGHEKGAFTGAERQKPGRLEIAGRGTVLLDEIGDMEWTLQGKLLRVLEERTFERVGGVRPVQLEARVIAASHRDLAQLVSEKKFRLDLFHRLSVFPIVIPPLRQRGEDIVLLGQSLLHRVWLAAGQAADAGARGLRAAASLRLSRQRARAAQPDRARGDPGGSGQVGDYARAVAAAYRRDGGAGPGRRAAGPDAAHRRQPDRDL